MEKNTQSHRQNLKTQLRDAHGKVVYSYTTQLKRVDELSRKNTIIKCIQIGLSAIVTGGVFSAIFIDKTIISIVSTVLSTLLLCLNLYYKEFNLSVEISRHLRTANQLWVIREEYVSLLTDFSSMSEERICEKRDWLQKQIADIYENAPKTTPKNYANAQKALKNEEEQYFSNEELNMLLPKHLREE